MSQETRADLQRNFLIGNCKARPRAWHNDPALRERLGLEDNHYDEPIPYAEVMRRLFNWKPLSTQKANLVPCEEDSADLFVQLRDEDGNPVFDDDDEPIYIPVQVSVVETEIGIIRSDTQAHIATHGNRYRIHDYEEWLLRLQSNVIGDTLTILGAGLPRNGAQAYVQVAMPDVLKDDKTGLSIMPYIMGSTSLDGSLPSTFTAASLLVVCDNTRNAALRFAERSGHIFKAKHTAKSLDEANIQNVRQALGIIHQTGEDMIAELRELAAIPVSKVQERKIWDIIVPIPKPEDATQRQINGAQNRRDALIDVYQDRHPLTKGMMNNMQGTAGGVLQGVSNWFTHVKSCKGDRFERNIDRMIRSGQQNGIAAKGSFDEVDLLTVQAIATVTNNPQLVSSN